MVFSPSLLRRRGVANWTKAMKMASAACVRRMVRSSLESSSCRVFNGATSTGTTSSSRSAARFSLLRRQSNISCFPRVLGPVSSLMPLHSATATALMTSMLSVKSRNWGWLSEGLATSL